MNHPPIDHDVDAHGERRRLTLLFTDLVGSSALSRALEAELYRALLRVLRGLWHEVAARHKGRVVMAQGDGALIVFGLDDSSEDDGRLAVDTALELHQRCSGLRVDGVPARLMPLRLHSGIHAGTLLVGKGDIELGLFDLAGDATNLAARLSELAGPGQILASLAALGPRTQHFRLAEPAPHQLAIDNPALARQLRLVTGLGPLPTALAVATLTAFVGRADTLAVVAEFVKATASQRCIVVQGNAGLGKTRFIEQLRTHAALAGCTVLRGACDNYLGAQPLQPFMQMLASLRDDGNAPFAADDASGAALQALRDLPADGLAERLPPLLLAAAASRRLVLIIDDWQWADDASRKLLQSVLGRSSGGATSGGQGGVCAIVVSRARDDGEAWIAGAEHLALQPFSAAETAAVVQQILPWSGPFLAARIHDYAGGIPLYIEELCHSFSADRTDPLLHAVDRQGPAQGWLATLVVSRLGRLPTQLAALVRAASVVGNQVPLSLLTAALGAAPAADELLALAAADFLHPEPKAGVLRFKHGITRDAVYDSIKLHERTALHERIAAALHDDADLAARDDALELKAYHARGASHWAPAAQLAEQAGDRAMAAFAIDRARAHYLAAMDAVDRLPDRGPAEAARWCLLSNKLGMACIFDVLAMPDSLPIFERALLRSREAADEGVSARAHYWLGYMCFGHGRFRRAAEHCRQALHLANLIADRRLAAQVAATLGQVLGATSQYDEALEHLTRALNAKQGHIRSGSSLAVGSAFTLACRGGALGDRGEFTAAHAAFKEAHTLLGATPHPVANSVLNWTHMVLLWQGRWQEALETAERSAQMAENTRALLPLALARVAGGQARWMGMGELEGFEQMVEAVHWLEQRQVPYFISMCYGWLVEACVELDRLAQARVYAARLSKRAREGEILGRAAGCRGLALAMLRTGDVARAHRYLAGAQACAAQRGSRREQALNQLCEAQMLVRQGDGAASAAAAAEACAQFRALGMGWHAQRAATLGLGVPDALPLGHD